MPFLSQDVLGNAATRRMSAGAYLDREYRGRLLRKVYNARNRRIAPSYGCDVVIVLYHAWRAWWLEVGQHAALLAVLGIAAGCAPREAVIAVSVLAALYLAGLVPGWARQLTGYYMGRGPEREIRRIRVQGLLLAAGLLACGLIALVAVITGYENGPPVRPGLVWLDRTGLAGAAGILASWAAVMVGTAAVRMIWLRQLRDRDAHQQRRLGGRMRVINDQQHHPLTVHSGFRPFVGSGQDAGGWAFAQRLIHHKPTGTEPDQEYDVPPFTARELTFRLKNMIRDLRTDEHPETWLPGLNVAHHVFVEGTHAARFDDVLRSAPASQSVQDTMTAAIAFPADIARHYLVARVQSWGGEVVTSVFVRVSLQGRTLYLEFATYALPPTRAEYHIIDEPRETGVTALARNMAAEILRLPSVIGAFWVVAFAPLQLWAALRRRNDLPPLRQSNLRADVGTTFSAREEAAIDADKTYFQSQDVLHHSRVIERRLIATVGDYLREKGVDTSEFLARAQAILNNGIIATGSGSVTVTASALGQQNSVTGQASPAGTPAAPQPTETAP